jgi:hypothetical protein
MIRLIATALAAILLSGSAVAQTVTVTSPTTVNPAGQPKAVTDVFVRKADGTIADPSAPTDAPSAAAVNAIVPATVFNATSLTAKASAGNFYGATLTNSSVAGFMIVANLAAAPASGAPLTAAQVLHCVPVAASGVATAGGSGIPDRATAGITLLASTSCSTYTPMGTAPLHMRVRAQ